VFSLMMVPAGRLQDKIGPRIVATVGGLLVGLGMIIAAASTSHPYWGYIIGFGILAGSGIGFGYASATPPAVKWFSAARTGLIAGIVVSGFGLASVYAAPLTTWLIAKSPAPDPSSAWAPGWVISLLGSVAAAVQRLQQSVEGWGISSGVPSTMLILGVAFLIVVVGLAQLLTPPPKGYVPTGAVKAGAGSAAVKKEDFTPQEMLRTPQFYLLWFMYFCGAGAGLMIIGKLAKIADQQAGLQLGFLLVASLAIGNGGGRILAGTLSDKLGRGVTMCGCFVMQAVLMILLSMADKGTALASVSAMTAISALIGANYGANLSLFPSITKDYYGLKSFGVNYGLVFTAWGIGGFVFAMLIGRLHKSFGSFYYAFYIAAGLLLVAAAAVSLLKSPHASHAAHGDRELTGTGTGGGR
jgi:MFS transporter, OFA family, oxalate/formate antiporter